MQPVRKKQTAVRHRRTPLAAGLMILLLLAAALWYLNRPQPRPEAASTEETPDLALARADEADIVRLRITPQRSSPYTLIRQGEAIILEGRPDYPLREETVQALFFYAAHLTADEFVADLGVPDGLIWQAYGLDEPRCLVEAVLADGVRYSLALGGAAPMEEPRYYARVVGDTRVYTVTSDVLDALNVPFYALHPVPKLSIDAGLIDQIRLSGEYTFAAERTDWGWLMTEPVRYPLSGTAMERLLASVEGLRFSTWAAESTPETRAEYGLETPRMTLTLRFAASTLTVPDESGETRVFSLPESEIVLQKGSAYSDTADYYLYGGDIVTGTTLSFSAFRSFDWRDYLSSSAFILQQNNLSALTARQGGRQAEYAVRYVEKVLSNNALGTDEYGSVLYEMRVRLNGRDADAALFSERCAALAGLEGQVPMETPWLPGAAEEPAVSLRFVSEDGRTAFDTALYPLNDQRDALTIDGVALFTVPLSWRAAFEAFLAP